VSLSPISISVLAPLAAMVAVLVILLLISQVPIDYNLRNLLVRWRITLLTALAFTLVIGLLVVMLAFVNGMYRLTQQSGQPGNVIVLSDGATDELFSNLAYGDATDVLNKISPALRGNLVRDEKGQVLLSKEVYLVANQPVPASPQDRPRRRFIQIRGIEDSVMAARAHGIELLEGQWFSTAGVQELASGDAKNKENAIQVVLGEGVARELARDQGKERLSVGDMFALGPNQDASDARAARKWIVTGIMKSAGSTFASEVWAKLGLVGRMFGKENYTSMVLRTDSAGAAKAIGDDIRANAKLKAIPETEYYSNLSEVNRQFLYAIIFVAVIMAVGGILAS
jgi:hypothetical protein